jgi:hypothetical protein
MSTHVYWLRQSLENKRPAYLTYDRPAEYKKYQANSFACEGRRGYSIKRWIVPDLKASQRGATPINRWDYYTCEGTFGVFSPRAIEVLKPYFGERFQPLAVRVEGHSYFCVCSRSRIDCLNKKLSEIIYFDKSKDVMEIRKYAFDKEALVDPMIFAIPELRFVLFGTESIPEAIKNARLRGFDCQLVDGGNRSGQKQEPRRKS